MNLHACISTHIYAHAYYAQAHAHPTYMHAHVHPHICTQTYIHTHLMHINICMHAHMYTYPCTKRTYTNMQSESMSIVGAHKHTLVPFSEPQGRTNGVTVPHF